MCLVSPVACMYIEENSANLTFTDIANFIYENPTLLDLSLQGFWIADRMPCATSWLIYSYLLRLATAVLGWDVVQEQIPAVAFVHKYEHVFAFKSVLFQSHLLHHSSAIPAKHF